MDSGGERNVFSSFCRLFVQILPLFFGIVTTVVDYVQTVNQ